MRTIDRNAFRQLKIEELSNQTKFPIILRNKQLNPEAEMKKRKEKKRKGQILNSFHIPILKFTNYQISKSKSPTWPAKKSVKSVKVIRLGFWPYNSIQTFTPLDESKSLPLHIIINNVCMWTSCISFPIIWPVKTHSTFN